MNNELNPFSFDGIRKVLDDATEEYHGVRPYGTKREEAVLEPHYMWIEGQGIVKVWNTN